MEDPDRPGDHACPHTLVTSIPDGIHKHKHTHNVNRWIEAKGIRTPDLLIANETRYQLRHSPMPLSRYLEIVHDPGASTQN